MEYVVDSRVVRKKHFFGVHEVTWSHTFFTLARVNLEGSNVIENLYGT